MIKNTILISLLFIISGCYSGSQKSDSIFEERLSKYNVEENNDLLVIEDDAIEIIDSDLEPILPKASEIFKERSYIELKTPEDIIIGEITKMKIKDDFMLILDSRITKAAYLFNTDGEFLFEVGIEGQGPGEHEDIIDIAFSGDHIMLMDLRFRLYEYDFNNSFIEVQEIPIYSHGMHVFEDGSMAFTNNEIDHPELGFQIIMIEGQKIARQLFRNEGLILSEYSSNPVSSNRSILGDNFLFAKPWGNEIFQISKDETRLRVRITSDTPITTDILNNPNKFREEEFKRTYIFNGPVLESSELILFRIMSNQRIVTIKYNKDDQTVESYKGLSDDLLYGGVSDFPLYVEGNDFYVPLSVEQMYSYKKRFESANDPALLKRIKMARPEFSQLMKGLDEVSNPIIMKCEIQ